MFDASPRPELLALLAAVKAEPDDDTAKLVLADSPHLTEPAPTRPLGQPRRRDGREPPPRALRQPRGAGVISTLVALTVSCASSDLRFFVPLPPFE
jgi:hypothetical protein